MRKLFILLMVLAANKYSAYITLEMKWYEMLGTIVLVGIFCVLDDNDLKKIAAKNLTLNIKGEEVKNEVR